MVKILWENEIWVHMILNFIIETKRWNYVDFPKYAHIAVLRWCFYFYESHNISIQRRLNFFEYKVTNTLLFVKLIWNHVTVKVFCYSPILIIISMKLLQWIRIPQLLLRTETEYVSYVSIRSVINDTFTHHVYVFFRSFWKIFQILQIAQKNYSDSF